MKVLITGASGQLGSMLQSHLSGVELALADLPDADITDRERFSALIHSFVPNVVIHCAAYTDVDGCVNHPELAYRVNSLGTQNVALASEEVGAAMVHISTNEVFAGDMVRGYEEWESPNPINVYGRTKAASEQHVRTIMSRYYIVRTAWLYAPGGHNFIHAILRHASQGTHLRVVTDEIGNPTYAADLALAIVKLIDSEQYGIYHLVNEGACSRFEFAQEVLKLGDQTNLEIEPILSSEFKRASSPPSFAALKNLCGAAIGIKLRPWQEALAAYMAENAVKA